MVALYLCVTGETSPLEKTIMSKERKSLQLLVLNTGRAIGLCAPIWCKREKSILTLTIMIKAGSAAGKRTCDEILTMSFADSDFPSTVRLFREHFHKDSEVGIW